MNANRSTPTNEQRTSPNPNNAIADQPQTPDLPYHPKPSPSSFSIKNERPNQTFTPLPLRRHSLMPYTHRARPIQPRQPPVYGDYIRLISEGIKLSSSSSAFSVYEKTPEETPAHGIAAPSHPGRLQGPTTSPAAPNRFLLDGSTHSFSRQEHAYAPASCSSPNGNEIGGDPEIFDPALSAPDIVLTPSAYYHENDGGHTDAREEPYPRSPALPAEAQQVQYMESIAHRDLLQVPVDIFGHPFRYSTPSPLSCRLQPIPVVDLVTDDDEPEQEAKALTTESRLVPKQEHAQSLESPGSAARYVSPVSSALAVRPAVEEDEVESGPASCDTGRRWSVSAETDRWGNEVQRVREEPVQRPMPLRKPARGSAWEEMGRNSTLLGKRQRQDDVASVIDPPPQSAKFSFEEHWQEKLRLSNIKRMNDLHCQRQSNGELNAPAGLSTLVNPSTISQAKRQKITSSAAAPLNLDKGGDWRDRQNNWLTRGGAAQASPTTRRLHALGRRPLRHDRKRQSSEGVSEGRVRRGRASKGRYWSLAAASEENGKQSCLDVQQQDVQQQDVQLEIYDLLD